MSAIKLKPRATIFKFKDDGLFWVDTGHADVGPFNTKKAARKHINRMISDKEKRKRESHVQVSDSSG